MTCCEGYSVTGTSGINGDAYYISPDKTLFLLADGASGAGSEGKVLMARLCVETARNRPFSLSKQPKEYLSSLIWEINNKLIALSQERRQYIFGTLIIGVVKDGLAAVAAVGDSPGFYIHHNLVKQVAKTKKAYYNLVEMGLYSEQELDRAVHQLPEHMWSMFDRFLPMVFPKFEMEEIYLNPGDSLVFCSDGVGDYVGTDDLKEAVGRENLLEGIQAVIAAAKEHSIRERGCLRYDDLTVVAYRLEAI